MLDGTYKLVGSAKDFKESMQKQQIAGFQTNIADLESQGASLQTLKDNYNSDLMNSQTTHKMDGTDTYTGTNVQAQLDLLEQLGYSMGQIEDWREDLEDGNSTAASFTSSGK